MHVIPSSKWNHLFRNKATSDYQGKSHLSGSNVNDIETKTIEGFDSSILFDKFNFDIFLLKQDELFYSLF
jgi:hypothetical protein